MRTRLYLFRLVDEASQHDLEIRARGIGENVVDSSL